MLKDVIPLGLLCLSAVTALPTAEKTHDARSLKDQQIHKKRTVHFTNPGSASLNTLPVPGHVKPRDTANSKPRKAPMVHVDDEQDPAGILTVPVVRSFKPRLDSRDVIVTPLQNRSDVAYYAKLDIGTPPQEVYVQVDTGSYELWVNPSCNSRSLAEVDAQFCQMAGLYDPSDSSSADDVGSGTTLRYGIGTAQVEYYEDKVGLAGTPQMDLRFGVGTRTQDLFSGILGLSYGNGVMTTYDTFLDALVNQSITETRAFAMGLGRQTEVEASMVFGGVDTAKFTGNLVSMPIIPAADSPDLTPRWWVQLNGISRTVDGKKTDFDNSKTAAFVDSGATLTLLPQRLVTSIARSYNAKLDRTTGMYEVACNSFRGEETIDFAFEGVTIKVPNNEFIRNIPFDPPVCYLGITASEDFILLGDTFMRAAYVVFDLDNDQLAMAPYANCGRKLVALSTKSSLNSIEGICQNATDYASGSANSQEQDGDSIRVSPSDVAQLENHASEEEDAASVRGSSGPLGLAAVALFVISLL